MKVKMHTLGCKVNQYETESITEDFLKNGYEITLSDDDADIFVVNSCTVTSESDRKTRQTVRRLKHNHPNSIVILTGCMPQAFPEMAQGLEEADIVIGNKNNAEILPKLRRYLSSHERMIDIEQHCTGEKFYKTSINAFSERTRAIVKIEDGCDRFCSYCIIPKARGRVRSKPIEDIVKETEALAASGFTEVVLVGINLSAYGKDTGDRFYDAVKAAADVDGIKRVRLGSLEPDHLTDEVLCNLAKIDKLCPQFHISLQSGSNSTLKAMNRHYTVRTGTRAALMKPQIEKHVKEERAAALAVTAEKIRSAFLRSQIGKTVSIIPETHGKDGFVFGYTENYTPVMAKVSKDTIGKTVLVKITDSDKGYCYAKSV